MWNLGLYTLYWSKYHCLNPIDFALQGGGQVSISNPEFGTDSTALSGSNHLRQGDNSNDMHNGREARQRKGGQNKDDRILQKFMPPGEAM